MTSMTLSAAVGAAMLALAACSPAREDATAMTNFEDGNGVSIRNLTESNVAAPMAGRRIRVEGTLIPTPSDTRSQHYLLRERQSMNGTVIAILREQRGDRVAYARAEVDCAKRLFHVVGVAATRAQVETATAHDGPLRPMAGLPLREELGSFVCARSGTPLAPAQAG